DDIRYFHVTGVQTCALPIFKLISNSNQPHPPPRFHSREQTVKKNASFEYFFNKSAGDGRRFFCSAMYFQLFGILLAWVLFDTDRSEERRVGNEDVILKSAD